MTELTPATPPTFRQMVGRFLRGLLRLLLFAIIVAVVTAAIYFAIPYIYSYTLLPVQNNRVAIQHLQQTQTQLRDDLTGQLADQRERITQLEADLTAEREARSQLESVLTRQEEMISAQATAQSELEARLESQNQAVAALEQGVDSVDAFLTDLEATVANVEKAVASPETKVASLQRQTLVLQMNQAILRARMYLAENNDGQAQLTLRQARQTLERLGSLTPPEKRGDLGEIQTQLETVITAIEEQPFIVGQELEILWQLLQEFSESDQ